MASIIKVNGKWRALVRRKDHKAICETHRTKAAADAWARGIEAQLDAGQPVAEERATVADLVQTYSGQPVAPVDPPRSPHGARTCG